MYSLMESLFLESDEYIINEGVLKFDSAKEAEVALKKCKNDSQFWDWFNWFFKINITPILLVNGVPIPIFHAVIGAVSDWYALPGSAASKKRKHKKFINKIDRTIAECEKKDGQEYKKLAAEYKKVRNAAIKEYEKWEEKALKPGGKTNTVYESSLMEDLFL